jgi:hypothetical protein
VRSGSGAGEVWYLSNTGPCVPGVNDLTFSLVEQSSDKATLDALVSCTWDNIVTASAAADSDIAFNEAQLKDIADPTDDQDAATKVYVDTVAAAAATYTAGAGLAESPAGTFNVVANADGSIVANPNDIQVGVLASDAQHGNRGGGGIHANAIASGAAGFMTGTDKAKLDGIEAAADNTLAGAGLTKTGSTIDVAAADATITVNANSIEASGDFVAKPITTTGALTVGASTPTTHVLTGITDSRYNGITNMKTVGRRLRQTTASDATDTVRFSPSDDAEAHARVGGIDRTFLYRFTAIEPTTTGLMVARWERDVGSGYGDMFQWVSSSPTQALSGIYVNRLIISSTAGGIWFDASNNRLVVGASGGLQLISADADDPQLIRSAVDSGSTDAIRSWASAATKTSAQSIHAFGSGTSYAEASSIKGDGVLHGPSKHFEALVTAAALDAKVCFSYEIDATTCVTVHLDQALAAYDGYEIEIINFGTSTNVVTFDVTSGGASTTIADAGVGASTKTASGAGFVIRFKCLGGDGWVVTSRYLC